MKIIRNAWGLQRRFFNDTRNPVLAFGIRSSDGPLKIDLENSVLCVTLKRPEARNALDFETIKHLKTCLLHAKFNPSISAVYLESGIPEFFCAGGDVKALYKEGVPKKGIKPNWTEESIDLRRKFFREEYLVNYLTANLGKPFVTKIEGKAIGGGVGLMTHGPYSFVTPDARFQMPECHIGFFPDVGAGMFLSRIPHNIGMAMGLTGIEINHEEANTWGIATHYTTRSLKNVKRNLIKMGLCKELIDFPISIYFRTLSTNVSIRESTFKFTEHEAIEEAFDYNTTEEIVENLYIRAKTDFPGKAITKLYLNFIKGSPTSIKVTHRYLKMAKKLSLEECFKYEYRISQNFMRHPDFYEGVRARLIDRDNSPRWTPNLLDRVKDSDVDKFFDLPPGDTDLNVVDEIKIPHELKEVLKK